MSEFRGGGSGNGRFNEFLSKEVRGEAQTDDEIRNILMERKRQERLEMQQEKRKAFYKKAANKVVTGAVALGVAASGLVMGVDGIEKGLRKEDYNNAMKNNIWADYDVTTNMEDLSKSEYADTERKVLTNKTEDVYDLKHGEGAFEELNEEQQNALVGETYNYYDKSENKPEDIAAVNEVEQDWAETEIGEDTLKEKIAKWFSKEG